VKTELVFHQERSTRVTHGKPAFSLLTSRRQLPRANDVSRKTAGARPRREPTWLVVSVVDRDLACRGCKVVAGYGASGLRFFIALRRLQGPATLAI
jgi:hypothetical protein